MQTKYSRRYFLALLYFSISILIPENGNCQNCLEVKDSFCLVEIEGLMGNGRPYSDLFIIKKDDYNQVLAKVDSFKDIQSLINCLSQYGTITFPVSERSFFATKNCYAFNSTQERDKLIMAGIDRFNEFVKKLKEDKRLYFKDGSQVFFHSKQGYFYLWKMQAKEDMLTYSSGMFFSDKLKYPKSYYFEIESIYITNDAARAYPPSPSRMQAKQKL